MRVSFLLGPAGSGKTWRCLEEIRTELKRDPGGPPLLLLAPKQATFQLERQLLADPTLAGYSRLQIVSFDRLAHWLLGTFSFVPELLDDEGRVMVLRALLAREHASLRVFRATARLPGFARQLSQLLREFQRHQITPARLARLAERCAERGPLRDKLHDLHHLLRAYHGWLAASDTQDGDQLLDLATALLRASPSAIPNSPIPISGLWLDGFAEMTPQEEDLLCAVLPFTRHATLAFCLDEPAADSRSWLSLWSVVRRTYADCRKRIEALPNCEVQITQLPRDPAHSRFAACPTLAHLEANWTVPAPRAGDFQSPSAAPITANTPDKTSTPGGACKSPALHLALCANPEAEATLAAREILRHIRAGGRYRDCAVLLRTLDHHHTALRRVFARYGIPCFLDRREPVAHHPLAELTRFALRTLAYGWLPDDWFGALKTGLAHDRDEDIDWLENVALAHGWRGTQWLQPLAVSEPKFNLPRAELLRTQLTAPFRKLAVQLTTFANDATRPPGARTPTSAARSAEQVTSADVGVRAPSTFNFQPSTFSGFQLATALRTLWEDLSIESRLKAWDDTLARDGDTPVPRAIHATVLRQMHTWLDNLERAFPARAGDLQSPPSAFVHAGAPDKADDADGGCKPPARAEPRPDALPLREWLPILEAGLSALTIGVIPPALDQVLIGTVDRSRNPELQLALVLGLNEGIFPAPPSPPVLLTDSERDLLAAHDTRLGLDPRAQIAHERYFAYIACTRSRARVVLSCSAADRDGKPLHPSPIIARVQNIFPELELKSVPTTTDWREAEHTEDLLEPILRELAARPVGRDSVEPQLERSAASVSDTDAPSQDARSARASSVGKCGSTESHPTGVAAFASLPAIALVIARWREISTARAITTLSPTTISALYGTELASSVSKLEQFAECPFKFFVAAGLGAEERKEFEVDHRERGSFIHRLLDEFHLRIARGRDAVVPQPMQLSPPGRRWRDLTPAAAAALAAQVGEDLLASPEFALFAADESRRFAARSLIASAQRLVTALVGWMPSYQFDPVAVELAFGIGANPALPAWRIELDGNRALSLRGRIDRVDLSHDATTGTTRAVVVDYKSSPKKLDLLKIEHGLQLQLLAYLNVLSSSRRAEAPSHEGCGENLLTSAATQLRPAGVFYIPLHGASGSTGTRAEILAESEASRRTTYQHAGRFDFTQIAALDTRAHGQASGQFRYRLSKDGGLIARGSDALPATEFDALLTQVETTLRRLGEAIFAGSVAVSPVRLSASDKACDRCDYRAICRFDPWTQPYRSLQSNAATSEAEA